MKTITNDNLKHQMFNLNDINNHKQHIHNSIPEILTQFIYIIVEYFTFVSDKITMKNKTFYQFIFIKGIDTIVNIFSMIFYYTKNLELTYYHTQKACYYYIEFIENLSYNNENNLKLTTNDAILFVYNQNIFLINNKFKKNGISMEEETIFNTINKYISLYKNTLLFIIKHNNYNSNHITKYCEYLINLHNIIQTNIKPNTTEHIQLFINLLQHNNIDIPDFFIIINEFVSTIIKKKYDEKNIKRKIYSLINTNMLPNDYTLLVKHIFSN